MKKKPTVDELEHKIKKLEESEKKYRQFFETAKVGIYRTRIDNGTFLEANQTLVELMGYSSVDQLVKEYVTSKHYTDPKRREELFDQIRSQGEVDGFEIEITRTDGSFVTIEISAAAYPELGYIEGVVVDITKRKQAEDKLKATGINLRQQYKFLQTLIDTIPVPVFYKDTEEIYQGCNKEFADFVGFTKEEIVGREVFDIFPKDSATVHHDFDIQVLKNSFVHGYENKTLHADGTLHDIIDYKAIFLNDQGQVAGIIGAMLDITDLKRAEVKRLTLETQLQQSRKMESIGTLAGGIAHEFNNILGIIIGNTELAMDVVLEGNPARYNLEEIITAGLRAKDFVGQLLSFSRQTDQKRRPIKLIPIIKDSLKLLGATIPVSIDIRQTIEDTSDTILADPTQIHQIMINLCTNAYHAMDAGGTLGIGIKNAVLGEDTASVAPDLSPGNYVELTVSDTGQGINLELKKRVFDPYFTTKEVGKGTGMGLSVVYGIVKSLKGAISVGSELGKGTTFRIYFPVIEEEAEIETEMVEDPPTGNERILFVENEE
ncbi:MAG: PAS domain S-box protein [Deltaproteobacteria bacterium]|nr:PAS domain S-box protein [Deltaproteobacteria bacterium]